MSPDRTCPRARRNRERLGRNQDHCRDHCALDKQSSRIVGTADKHPRCSCDPGGNRKQVGHSEKLNTVLIPNATAYLPGRVVFTYASAPFDLIPGCSKRLSSSG